MEYVIVGKPFTKQRIGGKKVRTAKKVHILANGKTLCQTENGYKRQPKYTLVIHPEKDQICKLCWGFWMQDESHWREPDIGVLMGEKIE